MGYSKSHLPEEVVLIIFNYIPNWNDRLQYATICKHYWHCINKNGSVRQVDLFAEKNLLKFKLARSVLLKRNVAVPDFGSRAVRSLSICRNLQTFVVRDKLMSGFIIGNLLKAAANSHNSIGFIVPASASDIWKSILDKQKFRAGAISVRCEFDDEANEFNTASSISDNTIDDLIASEGYQSCSIEPLPESFIVKNLGNTVASIGHSFAGCIICFEEVKFLITSFDAFVHIQNADDCSFDNKWINKKTFAKLHHKFEKGKNFFEVSVILHGCVELLAVGGLVALKGKPVDAFLGSSVKPLKNSSVVDGDRLSSKIFINKHGQQVIRSERLLRQYYKEGCCNLWSFHLQATHDMGFFPINPLNADNHPSVNSIALSLQSFIINSFARRQVDRSDLEALLLRVGDSADFMKRSLKLDEFNGATFGAIYDAITEEGKWKEMVKIVKMLEAGEISLGSSKEEIVANKRMVLSVGNRGYLKALSDLNDKNVEIAKSRMSM
ncbi:hypothetical protein INT47_003578 [Mucor saturninus]|uniref:F-box domain-containing protein n=1 Tax=Mucor saturninus TaxID=64648 RepID=A0A8H7ULW9_9FUNG|nr:hypothetical protein INT47_003578 [Mucor saturninus]